MGRGYVLQGAGNWEEAAVPFSRVSVLLPGDPDTGLRAREESAWCSCQLDDLETAMDELEHVRQELKNLDNRGTDIARCLWRLGTCCWKKGGA